jgi:hypothetical protein
LYTLWQSGQLARWGRAHALLSRLPAELADTLLLVDGFEPGLPPVVRRGPESGAWRVTLGDVSVGHVAGARVVAHAELVASVTQQAGGLSLAARDVQPRVSCVTGRPGGVSLEPCLSDLVPILRERLQSGVAFRIPDRALESVARFDVRGVHVQLSQIALEVAPPGELHLLAHLETSAPRP